MLGLGESRNEVVETLKDLRAVNVDIVTPVSYTHLTLPTTPYV